MEHQCGQQSCDEANVAQSLALEVQTLPEPLLNDEQFRYTIFPIVYHDLWDMYVRAKASFWSVEEVDLSKDASDWEKLTDNEKKFVKHVLAFFAASDTLVNLNLLENVVHAVKIPEANFFYTFQMAIENIHSEMYSTLIDTYIQETKEKLFLLNAISTMPIIQEKALWALKFIDGKDLSFAERIIAFIAVEGIFFSSSFASIFWLKKRGLMPGLTFSNELISRDEGLHCEFACLIYNNYIANKLPSTRIYEIIGSAVNLESNFVSQSLPVSLIGMNCTEMTKYVKFVADFWLKRINLEPLYHATNPINFMVNISLEGKTNFFEKKVGEYQKFSINQNHTFSIDEDF